MNGVRSGAAAALLAGPVVLAFASGGFFATARLWAAIVACLLAALAAVVVPRPFPRSCPGGSPSPASRGCWPGRSSRGRGRRWSAW